MNTFLQQKVVNWLIECPQLKCLLLLEFPACGGQMGLIDS